MTDGATGGGRRTDARVEFQARVELNFSSFQGFLSEYSTNVSRGGMFIATDDPKPPGTVVRFRIAIEPEGEGIVLVQGSGVVVWVREQKLAEDILSGMGIQFISLDRQSKELIDRVVDETVRRGGVPFDLERDLNRGLATQSSSLPKPEPSRRSESKPSKIQLKVRGQEPVEEPAPPEPERQQAAGESAAVAANADPSETVSMPRRSVESGAADVPEPVLPGEDRQEVTEQLELDLAPAIELDTPTDDDALGFEVEASDTGALGFEVDASNDDGLGFEVDTDDDDASGFEVADELSPEDVLTDELPGAELAEDGLDVSMPTTSSPSIEERVPALEHTPELEHEPSIEQEPPTLGVADEPAPPALDPLSQELSEGAGDGVAQRSIPRAPVLPDPPPVSAADSVDRLKVAEAPSVPEPEPSNTGWSSRVGLDLDFGTEPTGEGGTQRLPGSEPELQFGQSPEGSTKRAGGRRWVRVVLVVGVLLALGGAGWWYRDQLMVLAEDLLGGGDSASPAPVSEPVAAVSEPATATGPEVEEADSAPVEPSTAVEDDGEGAPDDEVVASDAVEDITAPGVNRTRVTGVKEWRWRAMPTRLRRRHSQIRDSTSARRTFAR